MTRGLIVAAPRSGSGKTIVTLGLMRALSRAGLKVAGFKNGPDYIDPAFHAAATGRASLNLDTWAMPPGLVRAVARQGIDGADLAIGEGSMGLFDGVAAPPGRSGATADLAAQLGLPILLVVDVSGQSQTAAAIVKGCDALDAGVRIAGVVLNRVASARHEALAGNAVRAAGYPIVAVLPRSDDLVLPERHLGLIQACESPQLEARLDAIADFVVAHADLAAIQALAGPLELSDAESPQALRPPGQRIALAADAAFSFIYPHLVEGWRTAGAEIRRFSPLADEAPPDDCDVCWLPGGYPELHAGQLAQARIFQEGVRRFARNRPVHGECGGYMVLGQTITDKNDETFPMVGLLSPHFSFARRKMNLGYRDVTLQADCCLGSGGTRLRGHEFHYATMVDDVAPDHPLVIARDAQDNPGVAAGSCRGNVTGSFFHVVARVG